MMDTLDFKETKDPFTGKQEIKAKKKPPNRGQPVI